MITHDSRPLSQAPKKLPSNPYGITAFYKPLQRYLVELTLDLVELFQSGSNACFSKQDQVVSPGGQVDSFIRQLNKPAVNFPDNF